MNQISARALGLLAVTGMAASSHAAIPLRYDGLGPHMDVRTFMYDWNDESPTTPLFGGTEGLTGAAGYFRYSGQVTNPTGFTDQIAGFCMEPMTGTAPVLQFRSYNVVSPQFAPDPGTPQPGALGMGIDRAEQIARAAYNAFAPYGGLDGWYNLTQVEAAAFNIALWEIIYEREDQPLDADAGFIKFISEAQVTLAPPVQSLVQQYLAAAADHEAPQVQGLVGMTHATFQDFLLPTPGAVTLAGLAAITGLRRRHR